MSEIADCAAKPKQTGELAKKRKRGKRGRTKAKEELRPREVELLRDLYEFSFWSVEQLAKKFEIPAARVKSLVTYKTHR